MKPIEILMTGATGLQGVFFLEQLAKIAPQKKIYCLIQPTSNCSQIDNLNLNLNYIIGDSSTSNTWNNILENYTPQTIIHIASIRHIPEILQSLAKVKQNPRLIVIGTTGVYSQYNQYSSIYKSIESQLSNYGGEYCLLRPTMIYGSHRDKNLHKLIKFCDKYGFFFVFGDGKSLLQPVHAEDLAQVILTCLQKLNINGCYNISGESVVNFLELLEIVEKILEKPIYKLKIPLRLGVYSATILETILGKRSPVRKEQILRLREDKAYPHDSAQTDLDFYPRSLETGVDQEIEILKQEKIISPTF